MIIITSIKQCNLQTLEHYDLSNSLKVIEQEHHEHFQLTSAVILSFQIFRNILQDK